VALKALNLMAGTDTSLPDLCNLIRPDVAFSSEVLRIANSPLVSFTKEVTNVLQASMLLGFRRLRSIVITVGLRSYMAGVFNPELQACWRHSVACGMIAERAAKACGLDKDFAYTAGVMHDIGRVVMAVSLPKRYVEVIQEGADQPGDLLARERALFEMDHCQVGKKLTREWGLPEVFSAIAGCHHEVKGPIKDVEGVVGLSCLAADTIGFGVTRFRSLRSYGEILGEFPEAGRASLPAEEAELVEEIGNEIKLIETA
jgi:putative nucleotidyltransferase with HDIG domain